MRNDPVQQLADRLTSLHPEVDLIQGAYLGGGRYAVKLQTPITVYLTEGSAQALERLVRDDIEACQTFGCPFCKQPLEFVSTALRVRCDCGAIGAASATELLMGLGVDAWPAAQAYAALAQFDETVVDDVARRMLWARLPQPLAAPSLLDTVVGPSGEVESHDHPWLLNAEDAPEALAAASETAQELGELETLYAAFPDAQNLWQPATCTHCRHCATLEDSRNTIGGLDSSWLPTQNPVCVYPLAGDAFTEAFAGAGQYGQPLFELRATQLRDYQTDEPAKVWNALLERVLAECHFVEGPARGLEAFAQGVLQRFFGPVCPRFALNPDHSDFGGYPYAVLPAPVPTQFGVTDFERERREREAQQAAECERALRADIERMLRELLAKPDCRRVMRARIEKKQTNTDAAAALVELLVAHLTPRMLRVNVLQPFSWAFNLSEGAASELQKRLSRRAEEQQGGHR